MRAILYTILGLTFVFPLFVSACFYDLDGGYGMTEYGGGGLFMVAGGFVWITVGVLACVWLWQNINKK